MSFGGTSSSELGSSPPNRAAPPNTRTLVETCEELPPDRVGAAGSHHRSTGHRAWVVDPDQRQVGIPDGRRALPTPGRDRAQHLPHLVIDHSACPGGNRDRPIAGHHLAPQAHGPGAREPPCCPETVPTQERTGRRPTAHRTSAPVHCLPPRMAHRRLEALDRPIEFYMSRRRTEGAARIQAIRAKG